MSLRKFRYASVAVFIFVLNACDSEPKDWEAAQADGSAEAYLAYLEDHPDGSHAAEARALRGTLLESAAWEEARAADTEDSYARYLESWTEGAHAHEAQVRRAGLAYGSVHFDFRVTAPEGSFMVSSPFGAIQSYPEGTELSLELYSASGWGNAALATVSAVYDVMDEANGRFVAADGACLLLGPTAETVTPCPGYEPPLPDPDDLSAALLYVWFSDHD